MADALRILITDEDPDSRVTTRRAIERAEFTVAGEVGYGAAAVSLALDARPDVIFVGMEDPVVRSLDTAEALANALPETPIIIYSTLNDAETIRRCMVLGARDYVVKPVEARRVWEAVNTVITQEERRHLRRTGQLPETGGQGTVITVTGAKGGIGKSVLSVNLALALQRDTGKSIAILDADTHFGDVATMLDLTPDRTAADLLPVLKQTDRQTIQRYLTQHRSGLNVLAAPDDIDGWSLCTSEDLKRIIDLLAQTHDFVVVDTAGSFDALVRACIEVATLTLTVTTGEVSSIRDTVTALRRLDAWQIDASRIKVVLNRGSRVNGFRVDDLRTAINRDIFWQVPYDHHVPSSVQVGQPVVLSQEKSAAARNVGALARRIAGIKRPLGEQPEVQPWWKRLRRRKSIEHDATVAT